MFKLYPRLAFMNIRKNSRFYFPYMLTVIGCSAAFYILLALSFTSDLPEKLRYAYLSSFLKIGVAVIWVFTVIFLFYTNSFLMKRRFKELALYNVLGMDKSNISAILLWESLYTYVSGTVLGIVAGMLLQRLVTMLMFKLVRADMVFDFYISYTGIAYTFIFFAALFLLILISNLVKIRKHNPVELMTHSIAGEKPPRANVPVTIIGIVTLGAGYAIALVTKSAEEALIVYFVAVFLVMIGTYCLFSAISIAVLRLLQKKKSFYYKTGNFIGISGMLYRMRKNAVGLANICILSTMVLVMVSATLSLFLGTEDSIASIYPSDLNVEVRYNLVTDNFDTAKAGDTVAEYVSSQGADVIGTKSFQYISLMLYADKNGFTTSPATAEHGSDSLALLFAVTADTYEEKTGKEVSLQDGEILFASTSHFFDSSLNLSVDEHLTGKHLYDIEYTVKGECDPFYLLGGILTYSRDTYYIVLDSDEAFFDLCQAQYSAYGETDSPIVCWLFGVDISGTDEEKSDFYYSLLESDLATLISDRAGSWKYLTLESDAVYSQQAYQLNGGFFFLGIFLGIIFLMAAVLIIYYKQISEGYEDADRYRIMQQIGLSKDEIRRCINRQILVVFFAPLFVSAVHVAFDLRLVIKLLTLFSVYSTGLTVLCTIAVFIVFAIVYLLVYRLTARSYYNIVSE